MRITADGTTYEYAPGRLSVLEAMAVTEHTGLSLEDWQAKLDGIDLTTTTDPVVFRSLQALIWMARGRAGERGLIAACDFDLATLDFDFSSDEERAQVEQALADKATQDQTAGVAVRPTTAAPAAASGRAATKRSRSCSPATAD